MIGRRVVVANGSQAVRPRNDPAYGQGMVDADGRGERPPARHRFPTHAHPGQFSFVMATGIVSVGLHNTHIAIAAGSR